MPRWTGRRRRQPHRPSRATRRRDASQEIPLPRRRRPSLAANTRIRKTEMVQRTRLPEVSRVHDGRIRNLLTNARKVEPKKLLPLGQQSDCVGPINCLVRAFKNCEVTQIGSLGVATVHRWIERSDRGALVHQALSNRDRGRLPAVARVRLERKAEYTDG